MKRSTPRLLVLALGLGLFMTSCLAQDPNDPGVAPLETTQGIDLDSLLSLDFDVFDQNMEGGWRKFEAEGDYRKAAQIIDAYLQRHADLASWQRILLHFHAGQMYAYVEDQKSAVKRFTAALDSEDVLLNWNPYVKATIAFLERDLRRLKQARDELVAGPKDPDGSVPNLDVVQRLITHFDSSYVRAYEGVEKE